MAKTKDDAETAMQESDPCEYAGCEHAVEHGETLCIFHLPAEEKDPDKVKEAFRKEVQKQSKSDTLDISGFIINFEFVYYKWVGAGLKHLGADETVFCSVADFRKRGFSGEVSFWRAIFKDDANFGGITFSGKTTFEEATFKDKADFNGVAFEREVDFKNASCRYPFFRHTTFASDAKFWGATFESEVAFSEAVFSGEANFATAKFLDVARFRGAVFEGKAYFGEATFSGETSFYKATFGNKTNFTEATFKDKTKFRNVTFSGETSFYKATFGNPEVPDVLDNEANFRDASFGSVANFRETKFINPVSFRDTLFDGTSYFVQTDFQSDAYFRNAKLSARGHFILAKFKVGPHFEYASLKARFVSIEFPLGTSFKGATIRDVEFRDIDMSTCLFFNSSGLEECIFSNVRWTERRQGNRWVIADEEYLLAKDTFKDETVENNPQRHYGETAETKLGIGAVEAVYRQLKVNYEKHKNFPDAGYFHAGEMKMRRLATPATASLTGFLLWSYEYLSGSGESIGKALTSLSLVILLSATVYSIAGFTIKTPNPAAIGITQATIGTPNIPAEKTDYVKFGWTLLKKNPTHLTHTFGESFAFSFGVATLRRGTASQTSSTVAKITIFLESILGPLTLGLFVLAIRRRLRRN